MFVVLLTLSACTSFDSAREVEKVTNSKEAAEPTGSPADVPAPSPADGAARAGFETGTEVEEPGQTTANNTAAQKAIAAPRPSGKSLQPQIGEASIDVRQIQVLLPPDAIPAIFPEEVSQIMVTVDEAEAAGIEPNVQVMGVSINGESHAYPVPFLSAHEIVNAEVGGRLIAATW